MAKNKNKSSNSGNGGNNKLPQKLPKTEIKKETVFESTSLAEFENNKAELFNKLEKEINELEKKKDILEKELYGIEERLESRRQEREQLKDEIKPLEEQIEKLKLQLKDLEKQKESNVKEANQIILNAELEKQKKITEAEDNAKQALQGQIFELTQKREDLKKLEKEIAFDKVSLEDEKSNIEIEREIIASEKKRIEKQKEKYSNYSPEQVELLKADLLEEQSKYTALKAKYTAQTTRLAKVEVSSFNELTEEIEKVKSERDSLLELHKKYPDKESIRPLEEAKEKCDKLEIANEHLERERDRAMEELRATRQTAKELEIYKQEVEATKALNEHLLKELESNKAALESRTGDSCPSLTKVDSEVETKDFLDDIKEKYSRSIQLNDLKSIVLYVKNYAGSIKRKDPLYYSDNDIRAFLAGLAVSRLLILQGMSGTGKSSLPRVFAEAIGGFNKLIPVESSWRDRNELLGYYNDFNKKFNAKSFTIELYRSGKESCRDIPTFIVLDEMNLARIEYYFSDFLAILQEPNSEKWLIELVSSDMRTLPMEIPENIKTELRNKNPDIYEIWENIERKRKGDSKVIISENDEVKLFEHFNKLKQLIGAKDIIDGRKIKVFKNTWFIGTANRDESTFEITDKVYDRAQVVSLNTKGKAESIYKNEAKAFISAEMLNELFEDAKQNSISVKADVENRLNAVDNLLGKLFDVSFGNRILKQSIEFVNVFIKAGGDIDTALDYQISTKIIRKIINSDDSQALQEFVNKLLETGFYEMTTKLLEKRIKELG